jgi:glycosyl-4,4'-diaponeurosporenoate acyltransferase
VTGLRAVVVFSALWAAFGVISGAVGALLPSRLLQHDRGVLRLRTFERGGAWYRRRLAIHRWKSRLPEAARWIGRAPAKASLVSTRTDDLARFAVETRRAELVHWANVAFGASFLLWTTRPVGLTMLAFGLAVHLPFVVVQRYNRARLARVLRVPPVSDPGRPRRRWLRRLRWATLLGAGASLGIYLVVRPAPVREVTISEAHQRYERTAADRGRGPSDELQPAPGVYEYVGSGVESLDRPPVSQRQGPSMPGTVTHDRPGCWTFRIDYSSKHHQSWRYCARGGSLAEVGGESEQLLDIVVTDVHVASSTTCPAGVVAISPDARPGDRQVQSCRATSTGATLPVTAAGPTTFVGFERVAVGGTSVRALHYHRERTFSGGQEGSEVLDLWFDARSALPLRNRHVVRVRTDSPLGLLTYTERGEFRLARLRPSR